MLVTLVAAVGADGAIGRNGGLPWRLPADLRRFRQLTSGKPVIMGRLTWDSLHGRPLEGRLNIVLSRSAPVFPGATVCRSFADALASASLGEAPEAMVIGGSAVYAMAMPFAGRMELTLVNVRTADADAFFPEWDPSEWDVAASGALPGEPTSVWKTLERRGRADGSGALRLPCAGHACLA